MKWVKVAIGAVIAIAVVPMIALSVFNLTQEQTKEEVVTFEIVTFSDGTGTTDIDVYDIINDLGRFVGDTSTNIISFSVNGNGEDISIFKSSNISISTDSYDVVILPNNIINDDGGSVSPLVGDVWVITFEVTTPPVLNGVTATLLLLAPLIFVSGILYFIYNNKQEGI